MKNSTNNGLTAHVDDGGTDRGVCRPVAGGWIACFVAAFALYALTANRGAQWQDSGYHILRAVTGESVNPLGLALTHPLHHWLSRFVVRLDLCEPAPAVTLLSALGAAVAVANVFGCVTCLTGDRRAGALAAGSLGVAHTFWQLATIAETYTITAALLSAECWCLALFLADSARIGSTTPPTGGSSGDPAGIRRWRLLPGMFLFNGLGLANHNLALLTLPVLAVVAAKALQRRKVTLYQAGIAVAAWLIGASPYLLLVIREALGDGGWSETLRSALFGHAYQKDVLNASISPVRLLMSGAFILLCFPNLLLPAAAAGWRAAGRTEALRPARRALGAGLAIHAIFALRYSVVDQHFFFLPMYVFLVLFGGIGFAAWGAPGWTGWKKRLRAAALAGLIVTPAIYAATPTIARRFDALGLVERKKPYRDDYVYLFTPWSVVERSAERMSRQAVELAGNRGIIIVEDPMAEFAVRYRAIREGRGDVTITRDLEPHALLRHLGDNAAIVLVPRSADKPLTHPMIGEWRRDGDLYVLAP